MCARKTVNLKRTELQFLRDKISDKYKQIEREDLSLNSNRNSYVELKRAIRKNLKGKVEFYISEYLLFKLFYETRYSSEATFNLDFINTLYLYLTEGRKNRYHYFNSSSEFDFQEKKEDYIKVIEQANIIQNNSVENQNREFWNQLKFKFFAFQTVGLKNILLIGLVLFGMGLVLFSFSNKIVPITNQCSYWVCKYENGTKVWSRFKGNISYEQAKKYFEGNSRKNRLNCEAFRIENHIRVSICYDNALARQYILDYGKIKCVYRE